MSAAKPAPMFRAIDINGQALLTRNTLEDARADAIRYCRPEAGRGFTFSYVERWECVETYPAGPAVPK